MKTEKIKAYKAFDMDFKCRDFQYEVGRTYHHKGEVELCESGFHSCTNPLDILHYYDLTNCRFAEVEAWGDIEKRNDDSKLVSRHIKVVCELSLAEFIGEASLCLSTLNDDNIQAASGYSSKLAASGNSSKLAASGYSSKLAASGDSSQLAASGNSSQLAASGDCSQLAASGKNSVAANIGVAGLIKGSKGTWITLAEYHDEVCTCVKSAQIDGKKLKANTWYKLQNGEFTEVEQ